MKFFDSPKIFNLIKAFDVFGYEIIRLFPWFDCVRWTIQLQCILWKSYYPINKYIHSF